MSPEGRRILKFVVQVGPTTIRTADEPRFLAAGWQGQELVVWAEATVGDAVSTGLVAIPTGQSIEGMPPAEYVGTAQTDVFGQRIVMHVYAQAREAQR